MDVVLTAALVEGTIFCMHGGLSPNMKSFEQVHHFRQRLVKLSWPPVHFSAHSVFIRATLASTRVLAVMVCLSVRLSVTSRGSTETAKRRIMQTTPHDSPGTLVFRCRKSGQSLNGVSPTEAPNAGGVS